MNFVIYLCAVLKNVIYGSSIFFTSKLSQSTDVLDILALRFLMSFVVMFILKQVKIIKVNISFKDFAKKSPKHKIMISLALTGLFEPVLYMLFETLGVSMTTNITASVLLSLAPISSAICEILFLKERTTPLKNVFLAIGIFMMIEKKDYSGENKKGWIVYAVLSAIFAAATSILAKIGIDGVESNLGTALRTIVVLAMAWAVVFVKGKQKEVKNIDKKELGFIGLSGIATGASWLCYYYAIQNGVVSVVVPIDKLSILVAIAFSYLVFGEKLSKKSAAGLFVMTAATVAMAIFG